ncbi:hypothetical protein Tco_1563705 [Tanacetum coccineum]
MVDPNTIVDPVMEIDYPHRALKNKGIVDSGCSRHMTGNKAYLDEFQDFNGGPVAFGVTPPTHIPLRRHWGVTDWHQEPRTHTLLEIALVGYAICFMIFMSSASSAVTYTSVYTDSEPGRPVDPPSPNYVPGPEHPPSPIEIPYVPEPEYPEYLVPSEDEAPIEDQPLPADVLPAALSPGSVPDSNPEEDPERTRGGMQTTLPTEGLRDEPMDDDSDDDTDDDDEEPFEDEEDDEEEEEHLAPADSSAILPPQIRIPFAQTRLHRARKTVRPEPPMSASMEARIAEYAAAPTPLLPAIRSQNRIEAVAASPPLLFHLLPTTDVPELRCTPQKRAVLLLSLTGCEIGESYTACRETKPGLLQVDTWDNLLEAMMKMHPTTWRGSASLALDREAVYARIAWTGSEEWSAAIEAHVRTLEAQVATLIAQTTLLQNSDYRLGLLHTRC